MLKIIKNSLLYTILSSTFIATTALADLFPEDFSEKEKDAYCLVFETISMSIGAALSGGQTGETMEGIVSLAGTMGYVGWLQKYNEDKDGLEECLMNRTDFIDAWYEKCAGGLFMLSQDDGCQELMDKCSDRTGNLLSNAKNSSTFNGQNLIKTMRSSNKAAKRFASTLGTFVSYLGKLDSSLE